MPRVGIDLREPARQARSHWPRNSRGLTRLASVAAHLLSVRLVPDAEKVLRSARAAAAETTRMGVRLDTLTALLVFIEDRSFFRHHGVSPQAVLRAMVSRLGLKRRSGGSTITQQLVRTLFIVNPGKLYRRKIVEMLLASWFERVCPKREILALYLSSVRFEVGVFGITAAMTHFLGKIVSAPSPAEAFFLIERVSNSRSGILSAKIDHTLRQAVDARLMDLDDAKELMQIYMRMTAKRRTLPMDHESFRRLLGNWDGSRTHWD